MSITKEKYYWKIPVPSWYSWIKNKWDIFYPTGLQNVKLKLMQKRPKYFSLKSFI